ncbi:hypothetical protein D7B24_003415 [Verticillium nonalfalfae]|uniref:WW domain-containing protein n=2 Tax=Verticillium TaxID=1036719 RepID=C9ST28_VERA1|nr:conserved hypothetical protein [Verticillium alfalfae VaMs.102]XP_028499162.1 uncharacterized protein D7B24_003415 [Verticillium nonalfalfae]EEY21943.1 conserved hypothetical protein [Verticillium alfalfae VaMs.102]RNJ61004.1 hypothetical protein D7B24_003415 [Verticillium nonalfalfae]
MTDQYLQEQHAYHIARRVQRERELAQASLNSNHQSSWVMIRDNGNIIPLDNERIRHRTNKISLELSVPKALQQGRTPFSHKSADGTAYITTRRVIYIPSKPTEEFKSFQAWILDCQDSHVGSPLFGAWYWSSIVRPSPGGGVPPDLPRLELKLSFREGGHTEFGQKFEELKERMEHVRRLQQETGQTINIPDEPLPAYEARTEGTTGAPNLSAPLPASLPRSASSASQNQRPNEPPPGYDEAQAQQIGMRLESHIRDGADRS